MSYMVSVAHDRGPDMLAFESIVELASSGAIYCGIAAAGDGVHVTYSNAGAPDTVRYRRSTDQGSTFASVASLNGAGTTELDDPIAADGTSVAVISVNAIQSFNDGFPRTGGEIAMRKSSDSGASFGSASDLTSGTKAFRFSLDMAGSTWNIAWMDYRNGYWDIFQLRSTDSGATWGSPVKLVDGNNGLAGNPGGPARPLLFHEGNDLYMVWMDPRDNRGTCTVGVGSTIPNCTEVYFKYSSDLGATWGDDQRLTTGATGTYAGRPVIVVKDGVALVSFDYQVGGGYLQIGYLRSTAKGAAGTWEPLRVIGAGAVGDNTHSDLQYLKHAGDVLMMWQSTRGSSKQIWARYSRDYGKTWGPEQQISSAATEIPAMAVTSGYVHVIWTNSGGGALKYRRAPITAGP